MTRIGISAGMIAMLAGAALAACPEDCKQACCASAGAAAQAVASEAPRIVRVAQEDVPHLAQLDVDQPQGTSTQQIIVIRNDDKAEIRVVDGNVSARVNGKEIDPKQVQRTEKGYVVKRLDGEDIVIEIPGMFDGQGPASRPGFIKGPSVPMAPGHPRQGQFRFQFAPSGDVQPRAVIGINISDPDKAVLEHLGLEGGVRIDGVIEGSAAEKAGLKVNDILVKIDDRAIAGTDDLREVMSAKKPGDTIRVVVMRKGAYEDARVTLGSSGDEGAVQWQVAPQVLDLAAPQLQIDVDTILKGLEEHEGQIDKETIEKIRRQLKEQLSDLHVELAPLHDQIKDRVFGEMGKLQMDMDHLKGLEGLEKLEGLRGFMMPHLKPDGVGRYSFKHEGGMAPKGFAFAVPEGGDMGGRLSEIEERLARIEEKLDRLAGILGGGRIERREKE